MNREDSDRRVWPSAAEKWVALLKRLRIVEQAGEVHPVRDAVGLTGLLGLSLFLSVGQTPFTWIAIAVIFCVSMALFTHRTRQLRSRK